MDIENRIEEVKNYYTDIINKIDMIDYEKDDNRIKFIFKKILLFSLIDSFIQEYSNFAITENKKSFINFINTFADNDSKEHLNKYDPVSLWYDDMDNLSKEDITLKYMMKPTNHTWITIQDLQESKNIISNCTPNKLEKHKYIELLYKYRNVLTHEMSASHTVLIQSNIKIPYYFFWFPAELNLVFPYEFLKNLFNESIKNYLDYCIQNNREPYANYRKRGRLLGWYK